LKDAFVCGEYAARYISALQSPADGLLRTVATAKHFSDYDQEGSHNESDPSSRMNFNAGVVLFD
jgi:beta-glucosidase-like glycosyl hydrolase